MKISVLLFIALGGAVGAVGRFSVMSVVGHFVRMNFPWATLAVNILGAFILGSVIELSALVWSPTPEIRAMVVVGMLGAFTTFSTFSMDLYFLLNRGAFVGAALYATVSVLVSLTAFWAGLQAFRAILG